MSKKQRIKIIFQQNPDVVYGITKARMFNKMFLREEFKMPTQIKLIQIFLLFCLSSLNESTFETKKNVLYFTPNALLTLK